MHTHVMPAARVRPRRNSDWGHARDYIKGMWLMVQRDEPSDYVLSDRKSVV